MNTVFRIMKLPLRLQTLKLQTSGSRVMRHTVAVNQQGDVIVPGPYGVITRSSRDFLRR
jgi:hypothetical protein